MFPRLARSAPAHTSPPHSMTSSARVSNAGGIVRPSAFAVWTLNTSSNLVGCSTGRCRLGALQDFIHIRGGSPKTTREIRSVGHEGARLPGKALGVKNQRHARLCREVDDLIAMRRIDRRQHNESVGRISRGDRQRARKFVRAWRRHGLEFKSKLGCRGLHCRQPERHTPIVRIPDHGHPPGSGQCLFHNFQIFLIGFGRKKGQAGDVAPWSRKTCNQSRPHRIGRDRDDNRDGPRCFFGGLGGRRIHGDDDVHLETDERGRELAQAVELPIAKLILDADVLALDPTQVAETLPDKSRSGESEADDVRARKPIRGTLPGRCCAAAQSGHAAVPPSPVISPAINSRRRMLAPRLRTRHRIGLNDCFDRVEAGVELIP